MTVSTVPGRPKVTPYQGNAHTVSLSSRRGPNDGLLHSVVHLAQQLSCLPRPSPPGNLGPSSPGLRQRSRPLPHPHLGTESSWGAAAQCPQGWALENTGLGQLKLAWGPGAGRSSRNSKKSTEGNPRHILPWHLVPTLLAQGPPDLC